MADQKYRTIEINIKLTNGVVILLIIGTIAAALIGYLGWGGDEVSAANPQVASVVESNQRQYYQSKNLVNGAAADEEGCAPGYHMAALWEILDTSNLTYNLDLGSINEDSGAGPPSNSLGWVRTGGDPAVLDPSIHPYNQPNCAAWTSSGGEDLGTYIYLSYDWSTTTQPWKSGTTSCSNPWSVWCIED